MLTVHPPQGCQSEKATGMRGSDFNPASRCQWDDSCDSSWKRSNRTGVNSR